MILPSRSSTITSFLSLVGCPISATTFQFISPSIATTEEILTKSNPASTVRNFFAIAMTSDTDIFNGGRRASFAVKLLFLGGSVSLELLRVYPFHVELAVVRPGRSAFRLDD